MVLVAYQTVNTEDTILISEVRNGNREAARQLFERYHKKVYFLAWSYLKNEEDALDATQSIFVKVFSRIDSFNGQSKFYTWVYAIAKNHCIDLTRKNKRWRFSEYSDGFRTRPSLKGAEAGLGSPTYGKSPLRNTLNRELQDKINQALSSLTDKKRETFLLREIDGLSYEEISKAMDCPIGTVMSRLHSARQELMGLLSEYKS